MAGSWQADCQLRRSEEECVCCVGWGASSDSAMLIRVKGKGFFLFSCLEENKMIGLLKTRYNVVRC